MRRHSSINRPHAAPRPSSAVWRLAVACCWVTLSLLSHRSARAEIVNLHQLKPLTRAQAGAGVPIRIKGVVVCYDAGWHQLYLHDGVETCYFNADDFRIQP